jgi:hypothetical protein
LRILEEHKAESHRMLDSARVARLHYIQVQSDLESKLDSVKYRNGQMRTEVKRHHELLGNGQRSLSDAMLSSAKATNDLDDFDQLLKRSHSTNVFVVFHLRRQDRIIGLLQQKLNDICTILVNDGDILVQKMSEETNLTSTENSLRVTINHESVIQSRLHESIASCRNELSALRHTLIDSQKSESDLLLKAEDINKLKIDSLTSTDKATSSRLEQMDTMQAVRAQKVTENTCLHEQLEAARISLKDLVVNQNENLVVERQEQSMQLNVDDDTNLELCISSIRMSLQSIRTTFAYEESSIIELQELLTKQRDILQQKNKQAKDARERLDIQASRVHDETDAESKRETLFEKILIELQEVKDVVNRRHCDIDEHKRKQRETECDKQTLTDNIKYLEENMRNLNENRERLEKENESSHRAAQKVKEEEAARVSLIEEDIERDMTKSCTLQTELNALENNRFELKQKNEKSCTLGSESIISLREQMATLIEGKHK